MLTAPFDPIRKLGLISLIGVDDQVDQNDYGASVEIDLVSYSGARVSAPISGEILQFTLISYESGTGAVQTPAGTLYLFSADPTISAGDTAMTAAERQTVIAAVEVEASDWKSDANGATATICNKPVAFQALSSLYAAWFHESATSYNDAAGDDEALAVSLWIRRDT